MQIFVWEQNFPQNLAKSDKNYSKEENDSYIKIICFFLNMQNAKGEGLRFGLICSLKQANK